jgi:hypothetical protein
MDHSWSYCGQVGSWSADAPNTEWLSLIENLVRILATMHRPRGLRVSWQESGRSPDDGYHELEDVAVASFAEVVQAVRDLLGRGYIDHLIVDLDTQVLEGAGTVWVPGSADVSVSAGPMEEPLEHLHLSYTTYIDTWLSRTVDEHHKDRPNTAAAANHPRLAGFLAELGVLVGHQLVPGSSQRYGAYLVATGFRDCIPIIGCRSRRPSAGGSIRPSSSRSRVSRR